MGVYFNLYIRELAPRESGWKIGVCGENYGCGCQMTTSEECKQNGRTRVFHLNSRTHSTHSNLPLNHLFCTNIPTTSKMTLYAIQALIASHIHLAKIEVLKYDISRHIKEAEKRYNKRGAPRLDRLINVFAFPREHWRNHFRYCSMINCMGHGNNMVQDLPNWKYIV